MWVESSKGGSGSPRSARGVGGTTSFRIGCPVQDDSIGYGATLWGHERWVRFGTAPVCVRVAFATACYVCSYVTATAGEALLRGSRRGLRTARSTSRA